MLQKTSGYEDTVRQDNFQWESKNESLGKEKEEAAEIQGY